MLSGRIGRLELISLQDKTSKPNWQIGYLKNSERIIVRCPENRIGRRCLVRIAYEPDAHSNLLRASFITSSIPQDFVPLSPERYNLVGIWTPEMEKKFAVPSLEDIKRYFPLLRLGAAYFLQNSDCGGKEKKVEILSTKTKDFTLKSFGTTFGYISKSIARGVYTSPIIIEQNESLKNKLDSAIRQRNTIPVYLENTST